MTSVYAHKNGKWIPNPDHTVADLVYAHHQGVWKPVRHAMVYRRDSVTGQFRWHTIFERIQPPPASVYGVSSTGLDSGVVGWTAPINQPGNVLLEYQVRRYQAGVVEPVAYPWTRSMTQAFSGLQLQTSYSFEVAVRATSGVQVENVTTSRATFQTGSLAVNRSGTNVYVRIPCRGTDTWSDANKWSEGSGGVRQGYASQRSRNGWAVVRYNSESHSLYGIVKNTLNYPDVPESINVAQVAAVSIARVKLAHRAVTTPVGAPNPWIHVHACLINTGSNAKPEPLGDLATFLAPNSNVDRVNFHITSKDAQNVDIEDKLKIYAQYWLNKGTGHNGLLIANGEAASGNATIGYNGYCAFTGKDVTKPASEDWTLDLFLSWNFNYPAAVNGRWV